MCASSPSSACEFSVLTLSNISRVARNGVYLFHLRKVCDRQELWGIAPAANVDVDECEERLADGDGIEQHGRLADDASAPHAFHTLVNGRGREADALAEIRVAHVRVADEDA